MKKICFSLLMGLVSLVLLEVGLRLVGLTISFAHFCADIGNHDNEIRILTVGESTTSDLYPGAISWPRQLEGILQKSGYKVKVINAARIGMMSHSLVQELEGNIRSWKPNLVISMMGVNDAPHLYSALGESRSFWSNLRIARLFQALKMSVTDYTQQLQDRENLEPDSFKFPNNKVLVEKINKFSLQEVSSEIEQNLATLSSDKDKARYLAFLGRAVLPPRAGPSGRTKGSELLERSFEYNKDILNTAENLAYTYLRLREYDKCHDVLQAYLEHHKSKSDTIFFYVFGCASASGDLEKWKSLLELRGLDLNAGNYSGEQVTKTDYRIFFDILNDWSIPLIAMQYPRQNVEALKNYFRDDRGGAIIPKYSSILFLSNEENFENALLKFGFQKVFQDAFAQKSKPFGHATTLGNSLIAETAYEGVEKLLKEKVLLPK